MKKVLQVTTVSISLGFITEHIKDLKSNGYKVDVATNIIENIKSKDKVKDVDIFQVDFQRSPIKFRNIKAYKTIKKLCKDNEYDIVHVHTPVAAFVTRLALRKEMNIKIIYTAHGFHFYKGAKTLNWILFYTLEKIAAKWTDAIITMNDEDFNRAKKFKLRKFGKIYKVNGVGIKKDELDSKFNKEEERKKLNLKKDDFVILMLAEINKNKNHIQLIKAINILKYKYPNIKAIFAGNGPLEVNIKNEIKKYKLDGRIELLGWRNDAKNLIGLSDVIGLFSRREGLPKCLMEAMMYETSIIATNIRGSRDLVEDGVNGFLVDTDDYVATAEKLEKLYLNTNLRTVFEQNSKSKLNDFLLENVLNQLNYVYSEVDIE